MRDSVNREDPKTKLKLFFLFLLRMAPGLGITFFILSALYTSRSSYPCSCPLFQDFEGVKDFKDAKGFIQISTHGYMDPTTNCTYTDNTCGLLPGLGRPWPHCEARRELPGEPIDCPEAYRLQFFEIYLKQLLPFLPLLLVLFFIVPTFIAYNILTTNRFERILNIISNIISKVINILKMNKILAALAADFIVGCGVVLQLFLKNHSTTEHDLCHPPSGIVWDVVALLQCFFAILRNYNSYKSIKADIVAIKASIDLQPATLSQLKTLSKNNDWSFKIEGFIFLSLFIAMTVTWVKKNHRPCVISYDAIYTLFFLHIVNTVFKGWVVLEENKNSTLYLFKYRQRQQAASNNSEERAVVGQENNNNSFFTQQVESNSGECRALVREPQANQPNSNCVITVPTSSK